MKQVRVFLLCVLMLLLSACSAQKPDVPENVQTAPLHAWEIETQNDMCAYLAGDWSLYVPSAHAEALWLTIAEDGTYSLRVDTGAGMWQYDGEEMPTYRYNGTWTLEPWEDAETPFLICFGLNETDDPFFDGWNSIGDFVIEEVTVCDGQLLVRFNQMNNGDSVLMEHIGWGSPWILTRGDERAVTEEVHANDTFYAHLWKSRYGCSSQPGDVGEGRFVIWADALEMVDEFTFENSVRECVPYLVSDNGDESTSGLSGGPDELFAYGDAIYLLTTDAAGEIISAAYYPTERPVSEAEAAEILVNIDEVRMMFADGMKMSFDGTEIIWNSRCRIAWMCTDHEEHLVREVEYAVDPYGVVFRYDPAGDCWRWVDPTAMG